jgi:hypothetical protein
VPAETVYGAPSVGVDDESASALTGPEESSLAL